MPEQPPTGTSGEGHPPYEEEFLAIGQILERDAEPIMERWYKRASAEQVHADPDQYLDVQDELLQMLRSLGQRLQKQSARAQEEATQIARDHGQQRSDIGWDIVEVARDYEILHGVVLEHLGKVLNERLTYRQAMIIATVVDRVTGEAVEAFSKAAQRRLEERAAELRHMTAELTRIEQRERRRLAQLLHDHLQQMLVAMRMRTSRLRSLTEEPAVRESAIELEDLIDQTIEASRSLTAQLSPPMLYEFGLVSALKWLGDWMEKNYHLAVHLQADDEVEIPDESVRALLFDSVRELLFNVAKHAQVNETWVRVEQVDSRLRLTVEDKGVGYDPQVAKEKGSTTFFGMASVRERIEWLGGSMQVDAAPDRGTRTVLNVPRER